MHSMSDSCVGYTLLPPACGLSCALLLSHFPRVLCFDASPLFVASWGFTLRLCTRK